MQTIIQKTKRSYHTDLILQYKFNLLPTHFKTQIPPSTLYNWKRKDVNKLFGYDQIIFSDEKIALVKAIAQRKSFYRITKAVYAAFNVYDTIFDGLKFRKSIIRKSKDTVVAAVEKIGGLVGIKRGLRFFKISYQQFNAWKQKGKCALSPLKSCFKKHPLQLSSNEVTTIKYYFNKFSQWDLKAIYYQMMRERVAFMSLSTWYKYASLLGLKSAAPSHRRKKYATGIRAEAPKKIIHMDVTVFRPMDNTRVFVYLVVDNFSRAILSYFASTEYRCKIALKNLQTACENHNLFDAECRVDLITDDGSENSCDSFINFLEVNEHTIRRLVAQKDITFSNSMIEAVNKKLKYQYLFRKDLVDFSETVKYLDYAVENYLNKPHGALWGFTPNEVLNGAVPDKYRFRSGIINSRKVRIEANLITSCGVC